MNKTLLHAARYLAETRGFEFQAMDEPMFDTPLVALVHQDTFSALNLLASAATDTSPALVSAKVTARAILYNSL